MNIAEATTVHWFQATMYSLSTGRLRVKFTLADCWCAVTSHF